MKIRYTHLATPFLAVFFFHNQGAFASRVVLTTELGETASKYIQSQAKPTQKPLKRKSLLNGTRISKSYLLFLKFKKQLFGLNPNHRFIAAVVKSKDWNLTPTSPYKSTFKLISSFSSEIVDNSSEQYLSSTNNLPKVFNAKIDTKSNKPIHSFVLPAQGHHSSGFGMRWGRMHNGIDIANATGTPIVASKSGRVVFAGWDEGYGYYVEIQHDDSSRARYAHLSKMMVKTNQQVETAQRIGLMGSTGRSTGPHLHFEIIARNGEHVDPHLLFGKQSENIAFNSKQT